MSEAVGERAILIGSRTPGNSEFTLGALGIARASYTDVSNNGAVRAQDPPRPALAFQVSHLSGAEGSALGVSVFGVAGSGRRHYIGAAVTINFGWFGEDDG